MRRPTSALAKAFLGTALAATTVSAQQSSPMTTPGSEPGGASDPTAAAPANPARGARHLLRNGWDYITYQEYERALTFFREAEGRQGELSDAERLRLKQGVDRAQRGLREASNGAPVENTYAKSGRTRRPGALALAKPGAKAPSGGLEQKYEREPIQLTSAVSAGPANVLPTGTVDPNVAPAQAATPALAEAVARPLMAPSALPVLPEIEVDSRLSAGIEPPALPPPSMIPLPEPTAPAEPSTLDRPAPAAAPALIPATATMAAPAPAATPASAPAPPVVSLEPKAAANTDDIALPELPPAPQEEALPPLPAEAAPVPLREAAPADTVPVASAPLAPPTLAEPAQAPSRSPAPANGDPLLSDAPALPPLGEQPKAAETSPEVDSLPALPKELNRGPAPEAVAARPAPEPAVIVTPAPVVEPPPAPPAEEVPNPVPTSAPATVPSAAPVVVIEPAPAAAEPAATRPVVEPAPVATDLPQLPEAGRASVALPASAVPAPGGRMTSRGRFGIDTLIPERSTTLPPSTLTPEMRREVERVAQKMDDDLRRKVANPQPEVDAENPTAAGSPASTKLEISRAPSPTEARPIKAIGVPEEFVPLPKREWQPNRKYWSAAATCHLPLYFQDASLERYGYSMEQRFGRAGRYMSFPLDDPRQSNQRNQLVQPIFSVGLFAAQIALLPYNMIMDPPWEAEYDLGYYRPGDKVPTDVYYLPLFGVGPPLAGKNYGNPPARGAVAPASRWGTN